MRSLLLLLLFTGMSFASNLSWMNSFDAEVSQYRYRRGQPSLAILRNDKIGNCVAFASCAADHVLRIEGYECYFVDIADDKEGHRFLYVIRSEVTKIVKVKIDGKICTFIDLDSPEAHWIVSVKDHYRVRSLDDALKKMGKSDHYVCSFVRVQPQWTLR